MKRVSPVFHEPSISSHAVVHAPCRTTSSAYSLRTVAISSVNIAPSCTSSNLWSVCSPLQLAQLRQADDVWNTLGVLNYLQALVGKSGIVEELTAPGAAGVQKRLQSRGLIELHLLVGAPILQNS